MNATETRFSPSTTILTVLRGGSQTEEHVVAQCEYSGFSTREAEDMIDAMETSGSVVSYYQNCGEFGSIPMLKLV